MSSSIGTAESGFASQLAHRRIREVGQARQRDEEPDQQDQGRDRGQPLQPPVDRAGPRRAEPAHPGERGLHLHPNNCLARIRIQVIPVSPSAPTSTMIDQNLLVFSS